MRVMATHLVVGLSVLCGTAWADLDTSNAYTGPDSFVWTGTTTVAGPDLGAEIRWCVKAPVLHNGTPQLQYLYQILAVLDVHPVSKFSVGLGSGNNAEDIGAFPTDPGDIEPTSAFFGGIVTDPDSANWIYVGLTKDDGDVSFAMSYWSTNTPVLTWSSVHNGGSIGFAQFPSPSMVPIPAPGAVLLGMTGLGIVCCYGMNRRVRGEKGTHLMRPRVSAGE